MRQNRYMLKTEQTERRQQAAIPKLGYNLSVSSLQTMQEIENQPPLGRRKAKHRQPLNSLFSNNASQTIKRHSILISARLKKCTLIHR